MIVRFGFLFSWLLLIGLTVPALAENKLAFVVGIDAYPNLEANRQLKRAVSDANAVGDALQSLGFQVTRLTRDVTLDTILQRFETFKNNIQAGDTVVLYYAGHGISLDDGNYLIPADIPALGPNEERRAKRLAIAERDFSQDIRASGARVGVIVIDACRDNPFPARGTRSLGSSKRGFDRMDRSQAEGLFSLYSAREGQAALDRLPGEDNDPNSVFTRVFLKALKTPGLDLDELGRKVRDEVAALARSAGDEQVPTFSDDLLGSGSVFLGGAAPVPPAPALAPDALAWSFIEGTTDTGLIESFLHRFPDSPLRGKAEARLAALKERQVAALTVAPAPVVSSPCGGVTLASFGSRGSGPLSDNEECALRPRAEFRECANCPAMVVVPSGSFTMGSAASEAGRYDDEGPQHAVTFSHPFAVGKFQVTVAEFKAFVDATGYDAGSKCWQWNGTEWKEVAGSWRSPGYAQTGSHPVACLSWTDAQAYVDWLSKTTGKSYRLLSESEWEYAARGRTSPGDYPRYFFGNDEKDICRYGNGADRTAQARVPGAKGWTIAPCSDGYAYTSPVGSFAANAFGLYDMAGNVWQWTQDCYHEDYKDAPSDGSAVATGDCSRRVLRGGSWSYRPRDLRAANRLRFIPENRYLNAGFRVARTLPL